MKLFDSNCLLGRRTVHTSSLRQPTDTAALLAEMDRLGIAEALVCHATAIDGHPAEGNRRLLAETADQPRLHPCWVLLPSSGEMPPPDALVGQMRAHGVRAARLCPQVHHYRVEEPTVGDLCAALAKARIPLLLDYSIAHWSSETLDWAALDTLCARFPELPFVVLGESLGAPRKLFPFWRRHPNLYLDTSYYQVHQGLSEIAERFGAERLLFGTGLPARAPGGPLMQLRYDFLTDADREAIAGGNLRRLLAAAAPDPTLPEGPSDAVTGLPAHPILDAHAHLGTWFSTYIHGGEADAMVKSMDRLGIAATALIAFDAIAAEMRAGNDQVAAAMKRHPGRFLGYATVDPNEPEAMAKELARCFDTLGFHAVKFHCATHDYPADGAHYAPALEYADAHGLAVLIHGEITERMLTTYPRAQFLWAHVGGWNGRGLHRAILLAQDFPNLHCELCSSAITNGAMEQLVERVGAEKIVHGSDCPLMDPGYQLGRVLAARLPAEAKEKILWRNALRLFRLDPAALGRGGA